VRVRFTGAGRQALFSLAKRLPPPEALAKAIDSICSLAVSRGIRLLFDAEQAAIQAGIDDWALQYMRRYNTAPGHAFVYGTYQAYLKSTPETLRRHLTLAQRDGFTIGVKLVRGAYLGSDPRRLLHDTKDATDRAYNSIAKSILTREWDPNLLPGDGPFPSTSLVLATHNAESVRLAREICRAGLGKSQVAFAQLQGMADEVSCDLVAANKSAAAAEGAEPASMEETAKGLQTYKYLVWGTTGECMKYLLRRAQENRDAVERTRSGRDAMWGELVRRLKAAFGMA
jgi:hypothetical protein